MQTLKRLSVDRIIAANVQGITGDFHDHTQADARDIIKPRATICNALELIAQNNTEIKAERDLFLGLSDFFRRLAEDKNSSSGTTPIDKRAVYVTSGTEHDVVIKKFQKLYHEEIAAIQKEISNLPEDKHDLKNIINVLDESLGDKFPKKVADVLRPYLTAIWKDAGGHVWQDKDEYAKAKKAAEKLAPEYLPQLENRLVDNFQKSYNVELKSGESRRDYFLQVIKNELEGEGTNPQKGIAIVESIATEMGKAFTKKQLFNAYRIAVSQGVMRHRNFSQVLSMEAVGYNFVEVVAITDDKTSPICRTMNGRRIDMGTATSYARKFLKADEQKKLTLALNKPLVPYALGSAALAGEWEDPKDFTPEKTSGKNTKDIVTGMKSQLPPYHPNCRTTVVPGMPERVVNRNEKELTQYHEPKNINNDMDSLIKRNRLLSDDEKAAKVNSLKGAKWTEENLEYHFRRRQRDGMYPQDLEGKERQEAIAKYKKLSENILKDFDYIFWYIDKKRKDERVLFYSKELDMGTVASLENGHIVTCFKFKPEERQDGKTKIESTKQEYTKEYIRWLP